MNAMSTIKRDKGLFSKALAALTLGAGLGEGRVHLLHESSDEIDHAVGRTGRMPRLHGMPAQGPALGRIEENYLYSTRRFPLNTANNTIGGGTITQGDYNFFTSGVGDQGSAMGYFSTANLTYQQTNMAPSGKIPTGRAFKLFDLAVSFNAQAQSADIAQLLDVCSLRFEKQAGQLVVQHGPIILWPGGVGMAGYAGDTTTVASTTVHTEVTSHGVPNLQGVRRFRNPRILNANEDFKYIVSALSNIPRANTAVALSAFVEMRIWLYGFTYDAIPG